MTSKRAFFSNSNSATDFNDQKKGVYLKEIIVFGVFLSQRSPWIMPSTKKQIEKIDVQIARAVVHFCQNCLWRSRIIHMSNSDIFFRCHQTD